MFSLLVIIILALAFYAGYRRGLVMQAVRLIGYLISFVLANFYFQPLSHWLEMFIPFPAVRADTNLALYSEAESFFVDQIFYRCLTFLLIWLIGWLLTNLMSSFLTKLSYYSVLNIVNRLLGGAINFLVAYFIVFMVLFLLSLMPIEFIQQQFVNHPLLFWIVDATPLLADYVRHLGLV
ncbi:MULTISPECIES: CvpA family protein [Facklamia]|uniref:Colicin V production protein n=1 Tax=Facklamia hominis CCUG 36813 TaxID=883111 RepID=K1LT29_9LACT|nr:MULTISPECIES: CvpA family protein [Facklamia]EKB55232.1 hypothetical protein HMPREF9706_00587 [Facklamia hominis CCUG 36813]EPH12483.1 hypothetical protein HMPREF9260_00597 [Facklamia hominis ACS-120-V-Sch10]OFL65921.1 colicin V production CvpA [Facklamia sp. HMSC062C11]RYC97762.1 CvpA family protein [Facklamia hominis]WPJ91324.1 CvpA family protein [Facklamia hominis]